MKKTHKATVRSVTEKHNKAGVVGRGLHAAPSSAGDITPALQKRKHLRRLARIFVRHHSPIYFIAVCTFRRQAILNHSDFYQVLVDAWESVGKHCGWVAGRYVVMPDHVHFFCSPLSKQANLSEFVGKWKNWTTRNTRPFHSASRLWQREFFDHLLRDMESYRQKWEYVQQNLVRAGLCERLNDWPYQGGINALQW